MKVSKSSSCSILISANITNVGIIDGTEIAQLYLTFPKVADEPYLQLRDFNKIHIKSKETETVTFELTSKDFSIWNVEIHNWEAIYNDNYILNIGSSSRDIRLKQVYELTK